MKQKSRNSWAMVLCFSLVVLTLSMTNAWAQNSSLNGTVTDPGGGVIPGSEVTITLVATGAQRLAVTDDQGRYSFNQMAPGTYEVNVELTGFKRMVVPDVVLAVDTPARLDVKLELGEISETVTVTGETQAMLNTVNASVGNAFNETQINELPLNSRNVTLLLSLQPGVTRGGEIAGARRDTSNLTLDGLDVNDQQNGTAFEPVLRVTPDSVQEFRVTITNPSASQGRSSGAQVSLITKSGSNEWHGSLYEFHRNTVTTSNNFFNNRVGLERPALIRNLFGGSIGGPIVEDKAFFFFNYEGRRDRSQRSAVRTVPLPHLGQGQIKFRDPDGNAVTLGPDDFAALYPEVGGVNPTAVTAMAAAAAAFPANDDGVGDGVNIGGFRFNGSTPLDQNTYTARLDFNLADNHQLFLRGNFQWDRQGFLARYPGAPTASTWEHPTGIAVGHTWNLRPTLINNFRYGLTRQAFTQLGDSGDNAINFRFIYAPRDFSRTLSRTNPVHNWTNDTSWIKGDHTFQFGANIRKINNQRQSFRNAYDSGVMNPSFYAGSGGVVDIPGVASGDRDVYRNAITTLLGRYSQFTGRFTFGVDGTLLSAGSPTERDFATEEFEFYFEDTWQVAPGLTLDLGLRWGVNTPVYETGGFSVAPTRALGNYFEVRKGHAARGTPYFESIIVDTAGPFYGKPGFYSTDKNNFMPRISAAWSPNFDSGWLKTLFGNNNNTVFRGGLAILYDRVGSALAVAFDNFNTLGFVSQSQIAANTFNVTTNPGPLFTGFDQPIRPLLGPSGLNVPTSLAFPLNQPADGAQRIERTLDSSLISPIQYNYNLSFGREFRGGLFVEASYLGRRARNLLANRDIMHLNNLVDPVSGMSFYEAGSILAGAVFNQVPVSDMKPIPYFENLFPNVPTAGCWWCDPTLTVTQNVYGLGSSLTDWTFFQLRLDDIGPANAFFHPQYGALNVLSTIASSDYDAFTFTVRERFKDALTLDFNYTLSKSFDLSSGGGTGGFWRFGWRLRGYSQPALPRVQPGTFQLRYFAHHQCQLVVGDAVWPRADLWQRHEQGSGRLFRRLVLQRHLPLEFGSGSRGSFRVQPLGHQLECSAAKPIRIRDPRPLPNKGYEGRPPNFWKAPQHAYNSYRDASAGEVGDRNVYRTPSFITFDFGLHKTFTMPYHEGHRVVFRWEVFNATNTQRLGRWSGNRSSFGTSIDPHLGTAASSFGNITVLQGLEARVMQFGLRYEF